MLCETWTNEFSDIDVQGYVRISKTRKLKKKAKRSSGGLEVYIRENLIKGVSVLNWDFEDGLNLKFDSDFFGWEQALFLFFAYFKPKNSSRADLDNDNNCFNILMNQIAKVDEGGKILISGDLNSRISNLQECNLDYVYNNDVSNFVNLPLSENVIISDDFLKNDMSLQRVNKDKNVNDYGYKLIDMCNECDLAILNGRAGSDKGQGQTTFCGPKGESTVDFVLCDKQVLRYFKDFDISDHVPYSDHKMLIFKMKAFINVNDDNSNNSNNSSNNERKFYTKWNEEKRENFIANLSENEITLRCKDLARELQNNKCKDALDLIVNEFSNLITNAGCDHIRELKNFNHSKRGNFWYDEDCDIERIRFLKLKQIFTLNNSEDNRINMCKQRGIYRRICRKKRKKYNISQAKNLIDISKKDPKLFWKKVKPNKHNSNSHDSTINFFDHFKNLAEKHTVLSETGKIEVNELSASHDISVDELDQNIYLEELNNAIKSLKRGKSGGNDAIVNEFIINAPYYIRNLMLLIFNNILELEYIPDKWCVGSIIPIFKSGDKNDANNYRGITLISVVCKLFTKIMNSRLNKWAEKNAVLTEAQFGFRSNRSTTDCLFILHGLVEKMLSKGKKMYAVFIDYEKAFDYLDRGAIWAKLIKNGISSKCIRIFKSMYEKMKLEVRNTSKDNYFKSSTGILQGECTSPIFFSFFVNDLEHEFDSDNIGIECYDILLKLIMYADDMVIFSDSEQGLQDALNTLDVYCSKWDISVNTIKTKVVIFQKGSNSKCLTNFVYRNQVLETVPFFKYLGLYLKSNGSFALHFKEILKSARRALFGLKKTLQTNPEIVPSMQLDLFNSMVLPILFYGCEVWGFCQADSLERFYISFLKSILCVKQSTPNCFVYGEFGLFPLIIERKMRIIKYWFKVLNSSNTCYI